MKRSNIEIEEILNSLDGISRAEARPFMHTRVMAKMQEENSLWYKALRFIARPAVAIACIAAVWLANAYTVINSDNNDQDTTITATAGIAADGLQSESDILAVNDYNPQ